MTFVSLYNLIFLCLQVDLWKLIMSMMSLLGTTLSFTVLFIGPDCYVVCYIFSVICFYGQILMYFICFVYKFLILDLFITKYCEISELIG